MKRYNLVSSFDLVKGNLTKLFSLKNVDYEVRAGLSSVYDDAEKGWVADDIHSESASRTLDYACMSFLLGQHTILTKQMTTMLPISWLYTLENLKPSPTSCMKGLCVHPF